MNFSILLPHFRTLKMTTYTLSKLFECKGKHEISVFVSDNNAGDGTGNKLRKLFPSFTFIDYPAEILQSHGTALDRLVPLIKDEFFITVESDSFPTKDNWLDYYEELINDGYDGAGSLLQLSGGCYMHPAGSLYRKSIWERAKAYCDSIEYAYLPNIAMKEGFPCHLMVRDDLFPEFCKHPEIYVELHHSYIGNTPLMIAEKAIGYEPVTNPFHNGMGQFDESFNTYGQRDILSDVPGIILKNDVDLIRRMGYEPGQWLHYYMLATGCKLFYIPTKTVWMPNRINQQQEYTINEVGFKHLWGVSAYDGCIAEDVQDIVLFKAKQVDELYQSIKIPGQTGDVTN